MSEIRPVTDDEARELLATHAPHGHNVTNEQYVALRSERDAALARLGEVAGA